MGDGIDDLHHGRVSTLPQPGPDLGFLEKLESLCSFLPVARSHRTGRETNAVEISP
jgi:hypothetical protein